MGLERGHHHVCIELVRAHQLDRFLGTTTLSLSGRRSSIRLARVDLLSTELLYPARDFYHDLKVSTESLNFLSDEAYTPIEMSRRTLPEALKSPNRTAASNPSN